MLIVRHLGTPNSSSLLASLDATLCAIQYYPDQWLNLPVRKMFNVLQKNLKFANNPKFCKVRLSNLKMGMKNDH